MLDVGGAPVATRFLTAPSIHIRITQTFSECEGPALVVTWAMVDVFEPGGIGGVGGQTQIGRSLP